MKRRPINKDKYGISKHRYLEVIHHCLQYPEWREELENMTDTVKAIQYRYQPGCTIRVDGESSKVYVDNVISMDDEVLGSTYFLAPPGETTVQIHCSEFSTPEPTVKAIYKGGVYIDGKCKDCST